MPQVFYTDGSPSRDVVDEDQWAAGNLKLPYGSGPAYSGNEPLSVSAETVLAIGGGSDPDSYIEELLARIAELEAENKRLREAVKQIAAIADDVR